MATAHFKTYDQVGKKEDISDVISNITPTETPFQSLIGDEKVNNTVYQWQEDSLDAVGTSAAVEGADATDDNMTPTVMRSNYTQIFTKTIKVSATSDAVSTYGRAKETALQLSKKSAELKRTKEYTLVGIAQNAVAGSTSVARKFGNVWGQDAAAASLIDAAVTVDAATTALTEAAVLSVNQKLYEQGGSAKFIMIKPADSLIVAGFAAAAGRQREFTNDERKVVNVVDVYVSPFGEQKVVLNRFMMASKALVFNPSNWKTATLRPFSRTLLAKSGDADRHFVVGEQGLKHVNYKATGAIIGLTGTNPMV